jgi:hypothetical protein
MLGAILPLPNTSQWPGAQTTGTTLPLPLPERKYTRIPVVTGSVDEYEYRQLDYIFSRCSVSTLHSSQQESPPSFVHTDVKTDPTIRCDADCMPNLVAGGLLG